MTTDKLRVAICQLTSTNALDSNIKHIQSRLDQIPDPQLIDLICFPENAVYLRLLKNEAMPVLECEDVLFEPLQTYCNNHQTSIMLGSAPILQLSGRAANATVWFRPNQKPEVVYRKIHLFDVDVKGAPPVRESDQFEHGLAPNIIEWRGWRIGLTICYDLRFAELFLHYACASVDGILVPSAFLVPTGEAHWHVLLRARAIESQCYVLAAAQSGTHVAASGEERRTYGHSLAVDPWGRILAECTDQHPVQIVELKRQVLHQVRQQIPMQSHRRLKKSMT